MRNYVLKKAILWFCFILIVIYVLNQSDHGYTNEMGSGQGSSYPTSIDVDTAPETADNYAREDVPNDTNDAVIAVQVELGSNPAGGFHDVSERLDAIKDATTTITSEDTECRLSTRTLEVINQDGTNGDYFKHFASSPAWASEVNFKDIGVRLSTNIVEVINQDGSSGDIFQKFASSPAWGSSDNIGGAGGSEVPTIYITAVDANNPATADYTCDGNNDQVQFISASHDLSVGGGGKIQLSDGLFTVSSAFFLNFSNIHIQGMGPGITVIQATTTGVAFPLSDYNYGGIIVSTGQGTFSNITISNLTLDCNYSQNSAVVSAVTMNVGGSYHPDFKAINVHFIDGGGTNARMISGSAAGLPATPRIKIINCTFDTFYAALDLRGASSGTVFGCTFQDGRSTCVTLRTTYRFSFMNNIYRTVSANARGIFLSDCDECSFSNNIFTDGDTSGSTCYAIDLQSNCNRNLLMGNVIDGSWDRPISIGSGENNVIVGNRMEGTSNITDSGSFTQWGILMVASCTPTNLTFHGGYTITCGTIVATEVIDLSPLYEGDALNELKNIKSEIGTVNISGWGKVDHTTLPIGLKHDLIKTKYVHKTTGYTYENIPSYYVSIDSAPVLISDDIANYNVVKEVTEGRNIGNNVQMLQRAVLQLLERVELLESQ